MVFCPILPKLKDGEENRIENFTKAGKWHPRQSLELENLSRSLKTEQVEFEVNSIPDMWARPILFETALFESDHSLHKRTLGEWRGLLALLALKELRRFNLTVQPLDMVNENQVNKGSDFLETLAKLIPKKKIASDSSWERLYIILFRGKPIGVTSPITLACTSTYYYNFIHGVSWCDGRFLLDPVPFLNHLEKEALAFWLDQLKTSLTDHPGIEIEMDEFNKLIRTIYRFINELGESRNDFSFSRNGLGMERGLFRYLDKPIGISAEQREISHVSIKPSLSQNISPTLLVVDRNISQQWDIHEKDIIVYSAIPLDGIPFSGLTGNRNIILGTQLENAEWCSSDDFFTKKLFVIQQKNAFPGAISCDGCEDLTIKDKPVTPILPLTDVLLRYLKAEDISKRLRFEQLKDKIRIFLRLPLSGPEGEGKDFVISKEYCSKKDEIKELATVPDLEVWPNFIFEGWKVYYTYFSTYGETSIFYAESYPSGSVKNSRVFKKGSKIERKITQLDQFPRAFTCTAQLADGQIKQFVQHNAGILLLKEPSFIKSQKRKFKVGIDFGTSGTNVYFQAGNLKPDRTEFKDRFLQVTAAAETYRAGMYNHFLPGESERTPFLSVYHDFLISTHDLHPLLDGHIFYLQDHKHFYAGREGMMIDLKWGDKEERKRALAFLKQLSLQCSAEVATRGASEISWRFSYPAAFSATDREAFYVIWDQIVEETQTLTGINLTDKKPIPKSESIASAGFFANEDNIKATLMRGAVFIDIGGGTSDISIWQGEKKMLLQTSLRFAGRDMFSYLLWKKPDFMNYFDTEETFANLYKEEVKKHSQAFYAQADAIISKEGEGYLKKLPELNREDCVIEFEQLIALGISGIFYYIGMLLQFLYTAGIYKEQRIPNIYVGGNGARLLHWLASGSFNKSSTINHLLKGILIKISRLSHMQDFEISISPEPKSEVACGLVTRDVIIDFNEDDIIAELLTGETFLYPNKEEGKWDKPLTTKMIREGVRASSKLEQLEDFLKAFNSYSNKSGIMPILFDDALLGIIKDQVDDELSMLQSMEENEIRIQPIFIIALKKLLETKAHEWSEKYRSE